MNDTSIDCIETIYPDEFLSLVQVTEWSVRHHTTFLFLTVTPTTPKVKSQEINGLTKIY